MLEEYYAKGIKYHYDRFKLFNIPYWSEFGEINRSRIVTSLFIFTTAVPIAIKLFPANKEICTAFDKGILCIPFELPFSATLLFIAGACATCSTAIHALRCPRWIKKYQLSLNFDHVKMDSMELFDQANRYFDMEYGVHGIPRFLLFCQLCNYDRTIAPLHRDFDEKYGLLCEWCKDPQKHGIQTSLPPAGLASSYPFIKEFVSKNVSGESVFIGTIRDQVKNDPERFFRQMYRLQDSGRLKSRVACFGFIVAAYLCLSLIFLQNIATVAKYSLQPTQPPVTDARLP